MSQPSNTPLPRKWVYAIWIGAAIAAIIVFAIYPILGFNKEWIVVSLVVLPFAVAVVVILPIVLAFLVDRESTDVGRRLFDWKTWVFRPKFASLEAELPADALKSRGLVVRSIMQSPAWIVFHDGVLTLHPIVGRSTEIPIDTIDSVEESGWFNGSWMPGQTGFMLGVQGYARLGFAIYDDPKPWREALTKTSRAS